MDNVERRYIQLGEVSECVAIEERDGSAPKITGISPPWNSQSVDLGGFREVFAPTAFDKILAKKRFDVPFLFNHDESMIIGRTTNGTLALEKSDRGLAYSVTPVDTQLARDLMTLIRTRTIFGSSFAFSVAPKGESWSQDEKGNATRTITEASGLYDISCVTRAAYPSSTVAVRSLEQWRAENLSASENRQVAERAADLAADAKRVAAAAASVLKVRTHGG
jgi:hypothetical protein